jgi:hypothetical protein
MSVASTGLHLKETRMPVPTLEGVLAYLAPQEMSWEVADVESAFNAEKSAQAARCKIPNRDQVLTPASNFASTTGWQTDGFTGANLSMDLGWLHFTGTADGFNMLYGAAIADVTDKPIEVALSFTYMRLSDKVLSVSYNFPQALDAAKNVETRVTATELVADYSPDSVLIFTTTSGPVDYVFRDLTVTIPGAYPEDLTEALYRRVAHNLSMRALPLGIQANISEMAVSTTRVGGLDAEVARLEAPYRKRVVG